MIELANPSPRVEVALPEYKRLLGYPRARRIRGRARAMAHWARDWFARHGRPWVYARQAERLELAPGSVNVDGVAFGGGALRRTLEQSQAHSVILVAVSAGREIEQAAQIAWKEGKPDEYFFLETFGSAVVERLVTVVGAELCAWAESQGMAVLPHFSPGYADWEVSDQRPLFELITRAGKPQLPGELAVLESGMLRPKKSLLGVFGLTRHADQLQRLTDLIPCERCSYRNCEFRRLPYTRGGNGREANTNDMAKLAVPTTGEAPLTHSASYAVNVKALERWSAERLRLETRDDGSIDALFRYDGTTCTNMGRPLAFNYRVKLGPRSERFPILEERCGPVPGDDGYQHMCRYLSDADSLMAAIENEQPLVGQPLNDVLSWNPARGTAGCHCEAVDRLHKWRLVLETIHYCLVQREKRDANAAASRSDLS